MLVSAFHPSLRDNPSLILALNTAHTPVMYILERYIDEILEYSLEHGLTGVPPGVHMMLVCCIQPPKYLTEITNIGHCSKVILEYSLEGYA